MSLAPVNFSERLVPRSSFAKASEDMSAKAPQAPDRGAEAHDASAQFRHYTEACDAPAPAKTAPDAVPFAGAGAVTLSDHGMILLRAVAAYENCSNEEAVMLALADYVTRIGAGPLARAVLDERERLSGAGSEGVPDDLHNVPEFVRSDDVRFTGARKAPRDGSRGLRR